MKWMITGLGGTLAPVLAREAASQGVEVIGWKRDEVSPDDLPASQAWLQAAQPDAIAHLGMGSPEWAGRLAAYAALRDLPFVFTSTAMVFHHEPDGPHAPQDARTAQDGYGQYKIACEDAVRSAHAGATIARIGWQIDPTQPGNNMLMALDQWQASQGHVGASRRWKPACSFMADTAQALAGLLRRPVPGIVHLDSNADQGHSFLDIVHALKHAFGRDGWDIRGHDDYVHDQRLVGGSPGFPQLAQRLAHLPTP